MAIDRFDLGSTPILKKTLDTSETAVTVTLYQNGVVVPINTNTATQVPTNSGRWQWIVDPVTRPTSGANQYEYNFYGSTYHQSRWGLFVWDEDQSRYNGVVTLDTSTGAAGTGYPTGTNYQPVNNLADAITIAQRIKTKTIYITGNVTFNTSVSGYIFQTSNHATATINLNNQNIANCTFTFFTLTGNAGGHNFTAYDCWLENITNANFSGFRCALSGNFSVAAGGAFLNQDCSVSSATGINVDCNGTGSFGAGKWDGIVTLLNMTSPFSYGAFTGNMILVLHPTVTAGNFYIGGVGRLNNYATATTTLTNLLLPFASFNEALTQYTTVGTAGYVQRLSAYGGKVYINTSTGITGTSFPAGTPFSPVDNLADALVIATTIGSKTINLTGALQLDRAVPGYIFESANVSTAEIDLHSQDTTDCTFNTITLIDDSGGYSFTANNCWILSLENCNFNGFQCILGGDFTVAPGGQFRTQNSSVGSAGGITIDCSSTGSIGFGGWVGIVTIGNMSNPLCYAAVTGEAVVTLLPTVTAGNMYFAGQGKLNNYATATTTLINYMLPYAVFDENLAQYVTQGTAGHTIRLTTFDNKIYINTSTGSAGTTFPIGAPFAPVNNLADAKTIADANGIKEFIVSGSLTLDRAMPAYSFKGGVTFLTDTININGQNISNSNFFNINLTGNSIGKFYADGCIVLNVTDINCYAQRTQFTGTITVAAGGTISGASLYAGSTAGAGDCIFDLQYNPTSSLIMTDFSGTCTIKKLAGGFCVIMGEGILTFDTDIVAGIIIDIGTGIVIKNYTPSPTIVHLSYMTPTSVFNEVLTQFPIPGTTGHAISKIYELQTSTGHISKVIDEIEIDADMLQTIDDKVDALITSTGHVSEVVDTILSAGVDVHPQDIRDAMMLAPTLDNPAVASIDAKLDEILAAEGVGGSSTVTITITDGAAIPIQNAYIEIWNVGLTAVVTYGTTDSNGQVQKTADDGTYKVKARKGGYTFNDPFNLTVSGDTAMTYTGATYIIDPASDVDLCRLYGYIVNGKKEAIEGITVSAVPYDSPTLIDATNSVVSPESIDEITTSTGEFTIDLIRNVKYTISISEIGFRKTVLVPNEAGPVILWSLTDVFISSDPSGGNPNW
jgi:hypothetical protein